MKIDLGMKIALIGPGIMEIPPPKWGAVEMLIWDYAIILKELGHRVQIINTQDKDLIKFEIEHGKFDIVHLHYDVFADILVDLVPLCKKLIVSSHYPYINTPAMWGKDRYGEHFSAIRENKDFYIFASSQKDIDTFVDYGAKVENTTPLVVKEALICGLGVVVSEAVSPELDTSKSFIDVIPEDKIDDIEYIQSVVDRNKRHSRQIRKEIRKYGIDTFGLENILAYEYIPKLKSLL
jgi:hypothetical protein